MPLRTQPRRSRSRVVDGSSQDYYGTFAVKGSDFKADVMCVQGVMDIARSRTGAGL